MTIHYIVAIGTFFGIFILFAVIGKTFNNCINHFIKIEYLVNNEYTLKKERIEIHRIIDEEREDHTGEEPAGEETTGSS